MKVLILAVVAITLLCGAVYADDITTTTVTEKGVLDDLPGVKQGAAWDFNSDSIMSLTSLDIAVYKKKLSLGIGFLTDFNESNISCLTLNYRIGNLEKYGFSYPLQEYVNIEFGIFGGRDFNAKEFSYGAQGSIIQVKF